MPILWSSHDLGSELPDRPRVTGAVQPVEHAIGASLGEQAGHPAGVFTRFLNQVFDHGRHGAPSPWRLSSETRSEDSHEGAR